MKALELKKDKYKIQINYSKEAKKNKLMKFITPSGDEFEISSDDMISFLVNQVNMKTLEPTFVESEKINVCEVNRQILFEADRDIKKGEKFNVNYKHPYPLEFALIEEVYKIAQVEEGARVMEITKKMIDSTIKKITTEMKEYTKKFYKSYKNINLGVEPKK